MKRTRYQVHVSGSPLHGGHRPMPGQEPPIQGDGAGFEQEGVPHARVNPPPRPAVRRFPPVLQFLTATDALVEQQLSTLAVQAHRKGQTLQKICEEIYFFARSLGYDATLGVQEVYSAGMPSFPDQTVTSALLLVDLQRIEAPGGFHQGRMAG